MSVRFHVFFNTIVETQRMSGIELTLVFIQGGETIVPSHILP